MGIAKDAPFAAKSNSVFNSSGGGPCFLAIFVKGGDFVKFKFMLKGKDWFGLYLAALLVYVVPSIAMHIVSSHMRTEPGNVQAFFRVFLLFIFMMLALIVLVVPILSKIVGGIRLNDEPLAYRGTIASFVSLNIGNLLLTIVTLAIFYPWYIKNVLQHVWTRIEFRGNRFGFEGKGLQLLVILILSALVPLIFWGILYAHMFKIFPSSLPVRALSMGILYVLLAPYFYLYYKWMMQVTYKGYHMGWNTNWVVAIPKILQEIFLSVITVGIYFPIAFAKLFDYFINRTQFSKDGMVTHSLRVKLDYFTVWKVTWVQLLLTIVTLGVYGAWAFCRIIALYADNTSVENAA